MRRRSVSGNTSPNAGFLLVRAESRSSTKVSPRFHYAQAQCFQSLFENTVQCGILVPQEGAVRMKLTCPGVSQPRPPISMLLTADFKLQKDHVFEIEEFFFCSQANWSM